MSHDTEGWRKVWRKTDFLVLKMMNLVDFDASSDKSENLHFDVLLLLKVYYVWAIKVQMSYVSQHWRMMQILRRNWLVL